jgi:adenylate kinase family enzyme
MVCSYTPRMRITESLGQSPMALRVLITGASGSGTTTLGQALAQELGYPFFDADDYYWLADDPPFQRKQDPVVRLNHLLRDLQSTSQAVLAGSILYWGAQLEDSFSLVIFLTVPAEVRVARLRARETQRFGRVDPNFLGWAAQYDEGKLAGRSLARHELWLSQRSCPILRIDGDTSLDYRLACAHEALSKLVSFI